MREYYGRELSAALWRWFRGHGKKLLLKAVDFPPFVSENHFSKNKVNTVRFESPCIHACNHSLKNGKNKKKLK